MQSFPHIMALSVGGALGVNARYWLGVWIARWAGHRFPWATVMINVSGSFAIGFLVVVLASRWPHPLGRSLVVTGFLGGYTTFSSFTWESLKLWEDGDRGLALANVVGSVLAGLVAVALGAALGRAVMGPPPVDQHLASPPVSTRSERSEILDLSPETFRDGGREDG